MNSRFTSLAGFVFLFPLALFCQTTSVQMVRFHTNLGDMDVTLLPNSAPQTVTNFMTYVNKGLYNNSVFHRSVQGFVVQGGGFQLLNGSLVAIPAGAAVPNEFGVSNTAGTIAMALTSDSAGNVQPNSATSEWFFNEVNNSSLDSQGFTVFGRISTTDTASLQVLQSISSVPTFASAVPNQPQIPLINYSSGTVQPSNYVVVISIDTLSPFPVIQPTGVVTATSFGGYAAAAPGSFIEIYGSNLAATTRSWGSSDFSNGAAPTSLDGVTVSIDGKPAYVSYVSPAQVNVQVPAGVATSGQVPVIVTYNGETSSSVLLSMRPYEGALLAPASFKVNSTQYVEAFHSDGTPVSNGNIPNVPASPAVPGETLLLYGVGFGPVTSASIPVAGQIVPGINQLATPVTFTIGDQTATLSYAGLAPTYVGLYQFNMVVPSNTPNGDQALKVGLGTLKVPQTLYLPVQAP